MNARSTVPVDVILVPRELVAQDGEARRYCTRLIFELKTVAMNKIMEFDKGFHKLLARGLRARVYLRTG